MGAGSRYGVARSNTLLYRSPVTRAPTMNMNSRDVRKDRRSETVGPLSHIREVTDPRTIGGG